VSRGLFVALYVLGDSTENFVSSFLTSEATSWYWLQRSRKRAKHQLRAQARGQVTVAYICDDVDAQRRLDPVLTHSARAITLAHRAPLISTTPHGATRMAVIATVDTPRSHAGAPVRDSLCLINA
jgi:hypothetical protein